VAADGTVWVVDAVNERLLGAMLGAKLLSPGHIVAIDLADARLEAGKQFGATPWSTTAPTIRWLAGRCPPIFRRRRSLGVLVREWAALRCRRR
jgi:hypothetical protein